MSTMKKILHFMVEKSASDVFISADTPVFIKINGEISTLNPQCLQATAIEQLMAEVLNEAQIQELEQSGELNISVPFKGLGNFRFSGFKQRGSYAIVIRYVPWKIPTLNSLQVPPILANLILEKRGLLLMVGANGVGKSTTLAAMLEHRNETSSGHILTIEDPIEFFFTNKKSVVNQREVGSDTQSLEIALKNALRQAPDVILIGEIRDRETMSATIAAAQSGHLCIATMHANNSYQALNRILNFYPIEVRSTMLTDLASSLKAVVSQRLLRTKNGTRAPAVEVMLNTKLMSDLIAKGDFSELAETVEKSMVDGSQTFEQDIARMITRDIVTRKEGLLNSDSPSNLMWRLDNDVQPVKSESSTLQESKDKATFTEITIDVPR